MAGVLTQNLVLQKSKVDDIRRVQKLNVCAAQLQDIGILRNATNIEVLSLSLNEISELGAISNCRHLNELYLRKNQIRDINQVLHLTRLPYLEVLNLSDNPISRDPNYRRFVVAAIPSLERLDDVNISDEERHAAVRVFPELTHFAPPASPYAQAQEGYAPPPAAQPKKRAAIHTRPQNPPPPSQPQQQQHHHHHHDPVPAVRARSSSYESQPSHRPPNAHAQQPPVQHRAGNGDGTPKRRPGAATPKKRPSQPSSYGAAAVGPSETGVVQAVKVLCSELSPAGLEEVRSFIDSMAGY